MRINLTKKDIVNAVYMQIGFSKKISDNLIDDIFECIAENLIKHKKLKISKFGSFNFLCLIKFSAIHSNISSIKLSEIFFEKPICI
jgi:hypothetical protein